MFIKLPLTEAVAFNELPTELYEIGLTIPEDIIDVRDILVYSVIENFVYVKMGIYNLVNKNRMYPSSVEETEKWVALVALHENWIVVDSIPFNEVDLMVNPI